MYALVNVGHEITNVNLVLGSAPVLTLDLPVGAHRFLETLQKNLGIGAETPTSACRAARPRT